MGPVMNLGARGRGDGGRAVPGRAGSGLRAAAGRRRRARQTPSVAKAAGVLAGDHIVTVDGTRVDTWEQFYMAVAARRSANSRSRIDRGGKHRRAADGAGRRRASTRSATSASCRSMHPQIVALKPGAPAEAAGLKPRRRRPGADGEKDVSRDAAGRDRSGAAKASRSCSRSSATAASSRSPSRRADRRHA